MYQRPLTDVRGYFTIALLGVLCAMTLTTLDIITLTLTWTRHFTRYWDKPTSLFILGINTETTPTSLFILGILDNENVAMIFSAHDALLG